MIQQTEQIQESEFISLKDFITNWTEVIEEMDEAHIIYGRSVEARKKGLNFTSGKYCLVGEAHHNDGSYRNIGGCSTCDGWCVDQAFNALSRGGETFKKFKETLYNHMIQEHPEKMRR